MLQLKNWNGYFFIRMWRNLTLTAPSSAREYVVWEYPIRGENIQSLYDFSFLYIFVFSEMYIHIHSVITGAIPVQNISEGFERVYFVLDKV
jgi:hypothetical protein